MANEEVDQSAIAAALLLEPGDLPDEWYIPAEPQPKGPYTIVEAARELMLFLHRTESKIVAEAVRAEREECAKLAENFPIERVAGRASASRGIATAIRSRASQPSAHPSTTPTASLGPNEERVFELEVMPTETDTAIRRSSGPAKEADSSSASGLPASPRCPKCSDEHLEIAMQVHPISKELQCSFYCHPCQALWPVKSADDMKQFFSVSLEIISAISNFAARVQERCPSWFKEGPKETDFGAAHERLKNAIGMGIPSPPSRR